MRRFLTSVIALAALSTSFDASARHHHRHRAATPDSFFLAGNPHVPLAVVDRGRVGDVPTSAHAKCGARTPWKIVGSQWNAIDTWGQFAGTYRVSAKDDYDVTGCAELSFAPSLAHDGRFLFVSASSAFRPAPSVEWKTSAAESASLRAFTQSKFPSRPTPTFEQCAELATDTLAFRMPGSATGLAVFGGLGGYVVARGGATWHSVTEEHLTPGSLPETRCFRPVAVFDMNGDGVPEIVMRFSGGDGWNEFVLSADARGAWHVVAASNGGSTA